uniref:Mitochondrial genome maintenance exonuclease 1 n=1 Tax=Homalodisca liturata TaxID=320908 RepID=A0A1B6JCA2_9HEMI
MLSLPIRFLLRNVLIIEKIPASCKCTNNEKANIIKSLNAENKYIYGSLLETQKQRRKRISKTVDGVPGSAKKLESEKKSEVSTDFGDEIESQKSSRKRKKKSKSSEIQTDSKESINSLPPDVPPTNVTLGVNNQTLESDSQEITRQKIKNSDSSNIFTDTSILPRKSKVKNNPAVENSDEFVFKSSVSIDEKSYPLQNPEKLEMFNQDTQLENVLNYTFSDPLIKNYSKFPSVSKIMEETMPEKNRMILSKWRKNMIAELGEEGFNNYNAGLKTRGSEFHLAVRKAVLGESANDYSEVTANALQSLAWMMPHISKPLAVESIVGHSKLEYKGIPDCVALFRNVPVVIDWKLSDKPKKELKDTYEAPVQIAAYIGAFNHDPNYKWGVSHGLVAVAYSNGDPCDVFLLSPQYCQIYWRHWLMRFDKFKARSHLHVDHNIDEASLGFV